MPTEYIYGVSPVKAALLNRIRAIKQLIVYETRGESRHAIEEVMGLAQQIGIRTQFASRQLLDELSQGRPHQNVILQSEPLSIKNVFQPPKAQSKSLALLLDDVIDPQNVGSIVRSCSFFGVDHLWLTRESAMLSPTVSKASAGSLEYFAPRIGRLTKNPLEFLLKGKQVGWRIHVAASDTASQKPEMAPVSNPDIPRIVVLGNEGSGVRKSIKEIADDFICIEKPSNIPEATDLDSLNVAIAAAIIMFKAKSSK